jgi:hypothetical protein
MIFFGGTRSRQSGWQIVRYVRYAGNRYRMKAITGFLIRMFVTDV